jgi:hypothetical protein
MRLPGLRKRLCGFLNLEFALLTVGVLLFLVLAPVLVACFKSLGIPEGRSIYYGCVATFLCSIAPLMLAYKILSSPSRVKVGDTVEVIHGRYKGRICVVKDLVEGGALVRIEIGEEGFIDLAACQIQKMRDQ